MELDKNTLFSIALELDLASLLKFCFSSKRINNLICKNDDVWRAKLKKEYPVVDVTRLKDPRQTYIKIVDAKVNSQKKFNLYLWNQDYEMRNILPKIYHIIWPYVGLLNGDGFMIASSIYIGLPSLQGNLLNEETLPQLFFIAFSLGLKVENILTNYISDINQLKDLFLKYLNGRTNFDELYSIINRLEQQIPQLKNILSDEIKKYLLENNQVYKEGTSIASLYLV